MPTLLTTAASGFFLGASLIIAIGAQNAFILRMGLARTHVFWLCLTCSLADALLIALGVAGTGALVSSSPAILKAVALGGALFLGAYAVLSARRALTPQVLELTRKPQPDLRRALATCLALTFLNPHVYLDTVVLVGAYSARYPGNAKLAFALGAMVASFAWFFSLGYGARLLAPIFTRPMAWRILDLAIAVVMATLALSLLGEVIA
ncbi:MAG: LysE/ArgO family amino acid transporter [Rhizobiaceae bacterium]